MHQHVFLFIFDLGNINFVRLFEISLDSDILISFVDFHCWAWRFIRVKIFENLDKGSMLVKQFLKAPVKSRQTIVLSN